MNTDEKADESNGLSPRHTSISLDRWMHNRRPYVQQALLHLCEGMSGENERPWIKSKDWIVFLDIRMNFAISNRLKMCKYVIVVFVF